MAADITLLVVEDDTFIQDILDIALKDEGFQIIICPDGMTAFAELDSGARRLRAVITDIRLGDGPDGWEVARRTRELVRDMPVIYMSGDSAQDWSSQGVPNSVMIAKPFVPAQLITAIATLLNKSDLSE